MRLPLIRDKYTGGFTFGKLDEESNIYAYFKRQDDGLYSLVSFNDPEAMPPKHAPKFTYDQLIGDYTDWLVGSKNIPEAGEAMRAQLDQLAVEQASRDKELLEETLKSLSDDQIRVLRVYLDER